MLKDVHALFGFSRMTEIVDVGANPIDGPPPYRALLADGLARVTGFEPQEEALAKLKERTSASERYLPYAIGDGTAQTLNVCRYSGWTSTLTPRAAALDVFNIYKNNAEIVGRMPVTTRKLDDVAEIGAMDFLKIDIQGGELAAFRGAQRLLAQTAVVQTEISFVALYENQPTFGEVDMELRRQGFIPHSFMRIKKGMIAPYLANGDPRQPLNQLMEADAVYMKDFTTPEKLTDDQLKHMGLIAHGCYGSFDLAHRCLSVLEARKTLPAGAAQRYVEILNAMIAAHADNITAARASRE